jgi:membrane protein DedA with SNARE-associated domain
MILLGTLFEGQPVMLFGGFAAHRDYLDLIPWVILAGAVGNFVGFQAWFLAGRKFGRRLLERRPQWAKRVEKVQDWLGRFESLLIVAIRFMPGFDTVDTVGIGMSRVSTQPFTVLNALGALIWAALLASAGYLLGNVLELVLGDLATVEKPMLIGIVGLTVAWVLYRQGRDHLSLGATGTAPGGRSEWPRHDEADRGSPSVLADAREKALEARRLVKRDGKDPIAERGRAKVKAFKETAEALIESKRPGWRNPKHRQQWSNTLKTYAYPKLGALDVQTVDTDTVLDVLRPIWSTKTETASRVRQRIEAVLDYATAIRARTGDNPARWKGHLDHLLPKPSKVRAVKHHAALDCRQAPGSLLVDALSLAMSSSHGR